MSSIEFCMHFLCVLFQPHVQLTKTQTLLCSCFFFCPNGPTSSASNRLLFNNPVGTCFLRFEALVMECTEKFYVHISVHHKSMYLEDQRDTVLSSLYLFYCQVTLHVLGVSRTHHQEYTNCSYNHWYKS